MITASDLGLTTAQWEALRDETGDPAFQFVLEQYSLSVSEVSELGHGTTPSGENFDATVSVDVMLRCWSATDTIYVETKPSEDAGYQFWSQQTITSTDIDTGIPISIVSSGATVRIFWYDTWGRVMYHESTDSGDSWSASEGVVGSVNNLLFIAATTTTRVHLVKLTDKSNARLGVATYSASWSTTWSYTYWPFTPTSFDAVVGNQIARDSASTNDVLVFSTDLPPLVSIKTEGTEIVKQFERAQGIVALRYQNGRWTDHVEVDVVDSSPAWPSRSQVRLFKSGDWIFLTYLRKDGITGYSHSARALSRTLDGISWELPYLLTNNLTGPAMLIKRGNHAYLIDSGDKHYRSLSVGYTGDAQVTQDISDYVLSLNLRRGDIQEVQATVANPNGVLDTTSPFSVSAVLQLRVSLGYYVGTTERLVQVLLADVDMITGSESLPTDYVVITGRDVLARANTLKSDLVREWQTQQIAGDNFQTGTDGTKYSGLRHSAVYDGHWETEDNKLRLVSNKAHSVVFTTYCPDTWNGEVQTGIWVGSTDEEDYAGVAFRAYDKENMHYVRYEADHDRLVLAERREGADTPLYSQEGMGWTRQTWYYLKVRFRYNFVNVYTSTDGISWTQKFTFELEGIS